MPRVNKNLFLLATILLAALALRLWALAFGLPYLYHPDEPRYVISAQLLFKTLNLDPLALPDIASSSFVYVANALAYAPYYVAGRLAGVFQTPLDIPAPEMIAMGTGRVAMPSVMLLGRGLTLLFALGNIVLVYLIGYRWLHSAGAGLLAALMMAFSPSNVINSRYVTPDTFVLFFALAAFLGAVAIHQGEPQHSSRRRMWPYFWTGIALGCLASTKVSGGLIVLPVLAAHFLRPGPRRLFDVNLLWLGLAGAGAFLLTTPYILYNPSDVLGDILFEGQHYAAGHPGMEGDSFGWYLANAWQTMGVLAALAIAEMVRGLYLRSKELILLSIYPLTSFIFISSFVTRNDRTFLPLTPFLFLLAASCLLFLLGQAKGLPDRRIRNLTLVALAGFSAVAIVAPLPRTISATLPLTRLDSRETARIWIEQTLPPGAKIAIESYAPFIDPQRYSVQSFLRMILNEPGWYAASGFEYLIFSQGMYGRFYEDPVRYSGEIALYERFFDAFELLKQFNDGGYEVRVYKLQQ